MKKGNILRTALINSLITAVYIILVGLFIFFWGEKIFPDENLLIPIFMLMLFVFSAGFTGFLVFGKPVMLYLDGKKKEALSLLSYTLGILFVIVIIVLVVGLVMG